MYYISFFGQHQTPLLYVSWCFRRRCIYWGLTVLIVMPIQIKIENLHRRLFKSYHLWDVIQVRYVNGCTEYMTAPPPPHPPGHNNFQKNSLLNFLLHKHVSIYCKCEICLYLSIASDCATSPLNCWLIRVPVIEPRPTSSFYIIIYHMISSLNCLTPSRQIL